MQKESARAIDSTRMFKSLSDPGAFKKAVWGVFVACLAYWIYLLFSSRMQISQDAIGYEQLGLMIYEKGWREFFRTGPHREPLYLLTIAISMKLGDIFSISYQLIQKVIQIMFLLTTQVLVLAVLKKLEVKNLIKLVALLYFGLSPAIVNSGFSLYSEIVTLPFMPAAILLGIRSWEAIQARSLKGLTVLSIASGSIFVLAAFSKAIFEYIFPFFLISFGWIFIRALKRGNKTILVRSLVYILLIIVTFNSFIFSYKLINKRFNGKLELTNRYVGILFSSVAWRAEKLSPKKLFTSFSLIPGTGICRLFFSDKECMSCEHHYPDPIYRESLSEALANTPEEKIKSETLRFTFKLAMKNPFQQALLMGFDALKMFFWESTQIGFVFYPPWLKKLFNFQLLKTGLRLVISVLTFLSIFSLAGRIFKKRRKLFDVGSEENRSLIITFFIFLIVASFIGLYSICMVITRYSLPIAPLYIIAIAYFFNNKIYEDK